MKASQLYMSTSALKIPLCAGAYLPILQLCYWHFYTFGHTENIRVIVYICTILNHAADLRGDSPAKIGMLAHLAPECVIPIYPAVPSVLDLGKVDHHTDCIRVQPGSLPILI